LVDKALHASSRSYDAQHAAALHRCTRSQVRPSLAGMGVLRSAAAIARESGGLGLGGFYRGFSAMALKYAPSFALSYACSAALLGYAQRRRQRQQQQA
jgi:hypothetical protein